jgi:hypothetical protein
MAENKFIIELLDKPFVVYPIHGKLRTVNKGRPTPLLPSVISQYKTKAERYRDFSTSQYEKVGWLPGFETKNKLYFWRCLFFPKENNI